MKSYKILEKLQKSLHKKLNDFNAPVDFVAFFGIPPSVCARARMLGRRVKQGYKSYKSYTAIDIKGVFVVTFSNSKPQKSTRGTKKATAGLP